MSGVLRRAMRLSLPAWGPADLAAALGPGPVALFDGLTVSGRRCTLVGWSPVRWASSIGEAQAMAAAEAAVDARAAAPALLSAAVGSLDWNGTTRFWVPGGAALFDPEDGALWVRGELPPAVAAGPGETSPGAPTDVPGARPLWSKAQYTAAVREVQAEMAAGRLVKVILSIPFLAPCGRTPLQLFRRLAAGDPPGMGFLLDGGPGEVALVGLSPEPLVMLAGRRAQMHLLAGTRPAGAEQELLTSPKDREEHAVAVEQARQDLLQVCQPESVSVDAFMELEHHPGLVHLASRLSGILRADCTPSDLVAACSPASTVGGIPRAAAKALIERLESTPREWYAGAVGALLPNGDLQLWLAIRSLSLRDGIACIRTGAGLVAGSDPEAEWQECLGKARRALDAVGATLSDAGATPGAVDLPSGAEKGGDATQAAEEDPGMT